MTGIYTTIHRKKWEKKNTHDQKKKLHGNEHTLNEHQLNKTWLEIAKLDRSLFCNVFTLDISAAVAYSPLTRTLWKWNGEKRAEKYTQKKVYSRKCKVESHSSWLRLADCIQSQNPASASRWKATNEKQSAIQSPIGVAQNAHTSMYISLFLSIEFHFSSAAHNMHDIKSRNLEQYNRGEFFFLLLFLLLLLSFSPLFFSQSFFWRSGSFCLRLMKSRILHTFHHSSHSFHMLHRSHQRFYKHLWIYSSNIWNSDAVFFSLLFRVKWFLLEFIYNIFYIFFFAVDFVTNRNLTNQMSF